jgi:hypothetical protein
MVFAAGTWTGHRFSALADRETSVGPRFLLLLYSDATAPSADDGADVAVMRQWARDLRSRGHYVTGARLARDGKALGSVDGVGSAPMGDGGAVLLSGFFIIGAATSAEAEAIVQSSPHVRGGGRAVLRPFDGS